MDEDKFLALRPWFVIKTPPKRFALPQLRADSLPWHPYLSREQSTTLRKLILRHGKRLSWQSYALRDLSPARIAFASAPTS